MKVWQLFFVLFVSVVLVTPVSANLIQEVAQATMPQFELEDMSPEEQTMLETFEVTQPSFFWHWVQKIGGAFIARCTIIKQTMRIKMNQIKGWWRESSSN